MTDTTELRRRLRDRLTEATTKPWFECCDATLEVMREALAFLDVLDAEDAARESDAMKTYHAVRAEQQRHAAEIQERTEAFRRDHGTN